MPRYSLDQLAQRIMARDEKRKNGNFNLVMEGVGADGGWNEVSYEERNNWNLTDQDMHDIEEALESNDRFETEIVKTDESTVDQVNDSVERMKKGDVSKFNHLPPFLREYYGKKSFEAFLGESKELPPLKDVKDKLKENINKPEFRYMVTQLIKRNAVFNGQAVSEKLTGYDKYMNKLMFAQTLDPVSSENAGNIMKKYPGSKGKKLLKDNAEKQRFLAKNIFMVQLGRVDIRNDEKDTVCEPFDGNVTELFAHGGRVMFTLPHGNKEKQDGLFGEWKNRAIDKNVLKKRRFASHDMTRRHVDDEGNMIAPSMEKRYKWKDQLLNKEFDKKLTTYFGNLCMNVPLGGIGQSFNTNDCVDGEGAFGHMYIRAKKGNNERCGAVLIGFENAAPQKESCIGQLHNFKAVSHDMSPFYSGKTSIGSTNNGREVDLSNFKPEELQNTLKSFDMGYRELQIMAENDERAAKRLKNINKKLCGKHMTALELASVMTALGIKKEDAVRMVETGRSIKNATYSIEDYPENKRKVMNPEIVPDRLVDADAKSRMNELRGMAPYVDSLKRQWNSMKSHTLFSFWNSDEFSKMEKSLNAYLKAYDNVMAGKSADGKELRTNTELLLEKDYNKLIELEKSMTTAAEKYHSEKVKDKKGGFEKHKTGQAKDRDSMSIMIAGFSEAARSMDVNEAVAGKSEQEKNRVARNMLNSKNRTNMENARASVPTSRKSL